MLIKLKLKSLEDIYCLLLSLFIVLTNETDGTDGMKKWETPCEMDKQRIIHISSTSLMETKQYWKIY